MKTESELSFACGCRDERYCRRGQRAVSLDLAGLYDLAAKPAHAREAYCRPQARKQRHEEERHLTEYEHFLLNAQHPRVAIQAKHKKATRGHARKVKNTE